MIKLIHQHSKKVYAVYKDREQLSGYSENLVKTFWKLAEDFPTEKIIWIEEAQQNNLNEKAFDDVFHHHLIMASCAIKSLYFSSDIGYVDQFPFANINLEVQYPTWLMSSDMGGIYASVVLKFKNEFQNISNFEYLLNAIAKLGQHHGLFCYHAPQLAIKIEKNLEYTATVVDLFSFAFQFYKKVRGIILLLCFIRYKKKYPLKSLIFSCLKTNFFSVEIDFSDITIQSSKASIDHSIDVVIPTIGRPKHLLNVLEDLKKQNFLPQKVIIVEQNPDKGTTSDFDFIIEDWPFEIQHIFTHQTGACNARNSALQRVTASWVFFCDDDNKFEANLLESAFSKIEKYGLEVLVTAYRTKQEVLLYKNPKQWGTFGAGNTIIKKACLKEVAFDLSFEYGYGEDMDFGMQLRNQGIDIVYHPEIEIVHLKAPMGGFRTKIIKPWEQKEPFPKPSPTVMRFIQKNYTRAQRRAYKIILWLKFYKVQDIKNPLKYRKSMQKRWETSKSWAQQISKKAI
ncbi:glycosyltransferase family 2 protein [Zunongwangia endophytica]|uniref:Glycosyltransferase family 2 protein n=1 Tax=Zunongwangia endophytica TaxID=1808945 RepID=A0ABV8H6D0_9FLAO|nr:glycosyltransferase family A protein [Zunongwangia endophytica]MDN3595027.1 glycosyltransferase family A protein [Zunongwangia endophytica]